MELSIPAKDWELFTTNNQYFSFRNDRGKQRKTFLRKFVDVLAKRLQVIGILH